MAMKRDYRKPIRRYSGKPKPADYLSRKLFMVKPAVMPWEKTNTEKTFDNILANQRKFIDRTKFTGFEKTPQTS